MKVLIANRGEIAIRIIRACKELGIKTVAVYSESDANSLHIKFADESICIGPGAPLKSYLSIPAIISAAEITGADAIHPGYGFLSENASFAEICEENNFKFIGPSPSVLRLAGDKLNTKKVMKEAGIPVIPSSDEIKSDEEAIAFADEICYPVIVKAALGGGGRGIRVAHNKDELLKIINVAKSEAKISFGSDKIYIEKYIEKPRHIEMQVLCDEFGNIVWLGERECSIQRRRQKIIEEAPSPAITQKEREKLGEYAIKASKAINYTSAGTFEFLYSDGEFYFMEVNARIQVEHPVTEMVTGIDIVKEQLKIAMGEKLNIKQEDVRITGHAIECRINAESPDDGFAPSPGKIESLYIPGGNGVRVDTHIYSGYKIPTDYDSLIAKLIVYGKDRKECIARLSHALNEFIIEGIKTTIPFHINIVNDKRFQEGNFHTQFLSELGIE